MKNLLLAFAVVPHLAFAGVVIVDDKPSAPTKTAVTPVAALSVSAGKAAAPAEMSKQYWDVRLEDHSIYGTLQRWAVQANPKRQIAWELPREFVVAASDSNAPFYGTFEEAVDRVLDSFEASDYPPKGCFYSNGVLRVVRRIGDGLECKR